MAKKLSGSKRGKKKNRRDNSCSVGNSQINGNTTALEEGLFATNRCSTFVSSKRGNEDLTSVKVFLPHLGVEGVFFNELDKQYKKMLTPKAIAVDVFRYIKDKCTIKVFLDDATKKVLNIQKPPHKQCLTLPVPSRSALLPHPPNIFKMNYKIFKKRCSLKLGPKHKLLKKERSCKRKLTGMVDPLPTGKHKKDGNTRDDPGNQSSSVKNSQINGNRTALKKDLLAKGRCPTPLDSERENEDLSSVKVFIPHMGLEGEFFNELDEPYKEILSPSVFAVDAFRYVKDKRSIKVFVDDAIKRVCDIQEPPKEQRLSLHVPPCSALPPRPPKTDGKIVKKRRLLKLGPEYQVMKKERSCKRKLTGMVDPLPTRKHKKDGNTRDDSGIHSSSVKNSLINGNRTASKEDLLAKGRCPTSVDSKPGNEDLSSVKVFIPHLGLEGEFFNELDEPYKEILSPSVFAVDAFRYVKDKRSIRVFVDDAIKRVCDIQEPPKEQRLSLHVPPCSALPPRPPKIDGKIVKKRRLLKLGPEYQLMRKERSCKRKLTGMVDPLPTGKHKKNGNTRDDPGNQSSSVKNSQINGNRTALRKDLLAKGRCPTPLDSERENEDLSSVKVFIPHMGLEGEFFNELDEPYKEILSPSVFAVDAFRYVKDKRSIKVFVDDAIKRVCDIQEPPKEQRLSLHVPPCSALPPRPPKIDGKIVKKRRLLKLGPEYQVMKKERSCKRKLTGMVDPPPTGKHKKDGNTRDDPVNQSSSVKNSQINGNRTALKEDLLAKGRCPTSVDSKRGNEDLRSVKVFIPHLGLEGEFFNELDEPYKEILSPSVFAVDAFRYVKDKRSIRVFVDDVIKRVCNIQEPPKEQRLSLHVPHCSALPPRPPKIDGKIVKKRRLLKMGPKYQLMKKERSCKYKLNRMAKPLSRNKHRKKENRRDDSGNHSSTVKNSQINGNRTALKEDLLATVDSERGNEDLSSVKVFIPHLGLEGEFFNELDEPYKEILSPSVFAVDAFRYVKDKRSIIIFVDNVIKRFFNIQ